MKFVLVTDPRDNMGLPSGTLRVEVIHRESLFVLLRELFGIPPQGCTASDEELFTEAEQMNGDGMHSYIVLDLQTEKVVFPRRVE